MIYLPNEKYENSYPLIEIGGRSWKVLENKIDLDKFKTFFL